MNKTFAWPNSPKSRGGLSVTDSQGFSTPRVTTGQPCQTVSPSHRSTRGSHFEYERLKAAWQKEHPEATHTEHEQAMREIARRCGV